jgi:hypothetical protein
VTPGIRPFLARFFASPAMIPIEDVKTQVRGEGPFDEIYVSDPESDEVLVHSAPRLAFEPELVADVGDDVLDDGDGPGMLERINWDLLVIGAVGVGLGWHAGAHFVDVPAVGAAVGLLPALGMAVNAYDGTASFDPAPIHTTQAQATLAWEQAHYADASLNEDLREVAWKERLKTALDGMALQKEADETTLARYQQQTGLNDAHPFIDVKKRQVQNWVSDAADEAAKEAGDDDYRKVSTHDLRRCWASHLLVEEHVSPRIVMALGGWSSYDAIEPYLAAPTKENIIESMSQVSL